VPESDAWANTIEHFAQCIQTRSQPLTTFDDGRRALQAVLACHQSSMEGRRVTLNEPAALSNLRQ